MTRVGISLIIACAAAVGARAQPANSEHRYLVSATPIDVGVRGPAHVCLGVDPTDRQGVWWWEAGATGCDSRSTGPAVFHADGASVTKTTSGIQVWFRIPLVTGPGFQGADHKDVTLTIRDGHLRVPATGADVATIPRKNLEIPERLR